MMERPGVTSSPEIVVAWAAEQAATEGSQGARDDRFARILLVRSIKFLNELSLDVQALCQFGQGGVHLERILDRFDRMHFQAVRASVPEKGLASGQVHQRRGVASPGTILNAHADAVRIREGLLLQVAAGAGDVAGTRKALVVEQL